MRARLSPLILLFLGALFCGSAEGADYNLHLVTDKVPDYTDLASLVQSSTGAWQTPQEKCIAVWRWGRRSRRQTSCAVDQGRYILDPVLHFNSYGAMNCGIISLLNISCWLELGYQARYVQLGDHTVSQVSWDEGKTWHLFDSSMSIFCYNHEGQVASCEEIQEAHACELSGGKAEPGHYYLYHPAAQCASHLGPAGWRSASDQPVGYNRTLGEGASSYTGGFSVDGYCQNARTGHRYVLNVRPCESYTRYWRPLDSGSKDPDYFRPMADGSDPDGQHGLNNIRGNGVWLFQPNLANQDCRKLFYESSEIASPSASSPHLHPDQTGRAAAVTFQISAANVITSMRIDAEGWRKTEADAVRVFVSRDTGIHWQPVWQADKTGSQTIHLKLRDEVAGGPFCWIKFEMLGAADPQDAGLNALKVTTMTQLNRRTLPALTLGSNQVLLRADEQVETVELWPPLHANAYQQSIVAEDTVFSDKEPDGMYKATLGAGADNKPCSVTWRVAVPTDITDVFYGVVSTVRSPRFYVSLRHSWDGERFDEFYRRADDGFPMDRQTAHVFSGDQVPAGARQAFFRAVFFGASGAATYNMAGIQDLLIRVHHKPRDAGFEPLEVTYNWTEHRDTGDVTRSHTELVSQLPHRYVINVAGRRDPTMNWVRVNLQGHGPEGRNAPRGYSDGMDVGPAFEYPKVSYRWGKSIAAGKPYTASRTSSTSSGNPDTDGRELTNGILIAPTDETRNKAIQPATAFWDAGEPVSFVVDVGEARTIRGVRVTTHQPNGQFCHPKSVAVAVSPDGQTWQSAGTIRHDDLWKPPGDYEPWEHDDSPAYESLPAGGRLAYSYPLVCEKPLTGRYLRFVCTPLDGKGMGISELQAFEQVEVSSWPAEIQLLEQASRTAFRFQ
jgi:hypothetical protein